MNSEDSFILERDAVMLHFKQDVASYCDSFHCDDTDLDEFFSKDAFLYEDELLGKTYAWINSQQPQQIIALITLANDSIKAKQIASSARNRLQRYITNAKRGRSYPAVLIGRLGVASNYRGKGLNIGSQILGFLKDWFRSNDNKTGCRFLVVDAYNNPKTLHFYEKNGFKPLYKSEDEERDFFGLNANDVLSTRFYYFDLKGL